MDRETFLQLDAEGEHLKFEEIYEHGSALRKLQALYDWLDNDVKAGDEAIAIHRDALEGVIDEITRQEAEREPDSKTPTDRAREELVRILEHSVNESARIDAANVLLNAS